MKKPRIIKDPILRYRGWLVKFNGQYYPSGGFQTACRMSRQIQFFCAMGLPIFFAPVTIEEKQEIENA